MSNFQAVDYREMLSWPSENGVTPNLVGRVNGLDSLSSAGAIATTDIKLFVVVTPL